MSVISTKVHWQLRLKEFVPKLVTCLKEGYTLKTLAHDLSAGITIGIISLPLAMAFAIASGLSPEKGLFTSIIAGFLISLLGGSRVQIGGPTGAFVVVVLDIVNRTGYEGLAIATVLGGFLLILMSIFRFGAFLKFIPYPVITGLTAAIAVVLFTSQMNDFFGLSIAASSTDFFGKWQLVINNITTLNQWALGIGLFTIFTILFFRRYFPRIPGAIIAVILCSIAVYLLDLPAETIHTKFGVIPSVLPAPSFPNFSLANVRLLMPDAITIAVLAGLESLLSAAVADGMTGYRHKSNCELMGQGIANIFSIVFGGIPATGAIARTATNVRMGAKTPVAGIIHAVTLFFIMLFFANGAATIPLAVLAGILIVISWNMAEVGHIIEIFKGPVGDTLLMLVTFAVAILIDITVGVEIGILLAALFFMKRMADATNLTRKVLTGSLFENSEQKDPDALFKKEIPEGVEVIQINGPLFFGAADVLSEALRYDRKDIKIIVLRMSHVPVIDMTGLRSLQLFYERCLEKEITLYLSGINQKVLLALQKIGLYELIGEEHCFAHIDDALLFAQKKLEAENKSAVL